MVGYAAERLQAHHVVYPVGGIRCHFARDEPALAKLRVERYKSRSALGLLAYVVERHEIAETAARLVEPGYLFRHHAVKHVHEPRGNTLALKVGTLLGAKIHEALGEEVGYKRRHDLEILVYEPIGNIFLGKRVEFEEYLSHHANFGNVLVKTNLVETQCSFGYKRKQLLRTVGFDYRLGAVEVFVAQGCGLAFDALACHGGIVKFGNRIAV